MLTLTTFSALARVLTDDDSLNNQIERCGQIMAADLPELAVRLSVGEQVLLAWGPPVAWVERRRREVAEQRKPLLDDAPALPTPFDAPAAPPLSYLGLPIVWEGRLWGVLEAQRPGALPPGERSLLASMVPLLAAAIAEDELGHLTLPAQAQPAVAGLESLAQRLEAPLGLNELLELVLQQAMHLLRASAGAINLVDQEREEYTLLANVGYEPLPGEFNDGRHTWPFSIGAVGRVARSGRASLLTDTTHAAEWATQRPDVRAEIVVPVRIDSEIAAVLVLATTSAPVFSTSDLALAQAIADLSARPLQRALAFQELMTARTQLQQTLGSLPLGLALTEHDGRVLRTNPAWYRLWHIPPPATNDPQYLPWDMLPLLLKRLSHPLELTDFFAECQAHPDQTLELSLRLLEPDQDVRLRATPVLNPQAEPTGRLVMIEDLTREREIDKMKNEFVSVVSHELRTPLTSILGYTELLLARDFPPHERQEFVQTVYNQASQLSKMVDDLLNLSRLDAGQIKLSRWVVSLHQLAYDITKQLNESLSAQHRLLIDVPPALPPIYADKEKIRQVLTNLLSNAIKYSPEGGQVALVARELRTPPPGAPQLPSERQVLIAVIDQGIGIASQDLPNVFNRFFRVDNSMTRKIGGTGLGLSITKALVELHGGRIWLTSEFGKGTTFWLTLPVASELARRG